MLVLVHHDITDPGEFWRIAAGGLAGEPRGMTLHKIARDVATGQVTCTWEAADMAVVREFIESEVGHVSTNRFAEPAISALRADGPFTRSELQWIFQSGAIKDGSAIEAPQAASDAFDLLVLAVIDRFALGVILADGHGRPRVVNSAAERILGLADGLSMTHAGMCAAAHADSRALQLAIAAAATAAEDGGRHPGHALTIARPSLKRSFSLLVTPLRARTTVAGGQRPPAVAIFISDPERAVSPNAELLQKLYELTPTESQVAAFIAEGLSIEHIAQQLAMSVHTARWHLKHIFLKAGTDSQRDLVRLILNGPAALGPR